ncbi:MAG: ribose 5-phosphate isomerase B [Anaerolineae bacterium]|nr:ribose 5-phosphate isomerase B [Anaerolineae bacterium]
MSDEQSIRRAVAAALRRQLGQGSSRPVIDEAAVTAVPEGGELRLPPGALVTPLAYSTALDRRVKLIPESEAGYAAPEGQVIALGADHGGYPLKEALKAELQTRYTVLDCGTNSAEAVDYPDFALAVAEAVASGQAWRGIMIDGAGIGSCMVANKVPGVRAALCYDHATAVNSREHNDANLLTLGAGLIGTPLAKQIVQVWLTTPFGGGRHAKRVDKIIALDKRLRGGSA